MKTPKKHKKYIERRMDSVPTSPSSVEKHSDGCKIENNAGGGHTFMPKCDRYDPKAFFSASPTSVPAKGSDIQPCSQPQSWEESFKEWYEHWGKKVPVESVIDHINHYIKSSILLSNKTKLREDIEGMKKVESYPSNCMVVVSQENIEYNKALNDILNILR